jgi:hypothetical protein
MVPEAGLEPAQAFTRGILSPTKTIKLDLCQIISNEFFQ